MNWHEKQDSSTVHVRCPFTPCNKLHDGLKLLPRFTLGHPCEHKPPTTVRPSSRPDKLLHLGRPSIRQLTRDLPRLFIDNTATQPRFSIGLLSKHNAVAELQ